MIIIYFFKYLKNFFYRSHFSHQFLTASYPILLGVTVLTRADCAY